MLIKLEDYINCEPPVNLLLSSVHEEPKSMTNSIQFKKKNLWNRGN